MLNKINVNSIQNSEKINQSKHKKVYSDKFSSILKNKLDSSNAKLVKKKEANLLNFPNNFVKVNNPLKQVPENLKNSKLDFSTHAIKRINQRNINIDDQELLKIESAFDKAKEKGVKDLLIYSGDKALVASVANNKIITVVDKGSLEDHIFTNIDGTAII